MKLWEIGVLAGCGCVALALIAVFTYSLLVMAKRGDHMQKPTLIRGEDPAHGVWLLQDEDFQLGPLTQEWLDQEARGGHKTENPFKPKGGRNGS